VVICHVTGLKDALLNRKSIYIHIAIIHCRVSATSLEISSCAQDTNASGLVAMALTAFASRFDASRRLGLPGHWEV